jgi:hypothetical protein
VVCLLLRIAKNIIVLNVYFLWSRVHIVFVHIKGMSPGGNMEFEGAPFKLTSEYIELLDGVNSPMFDAFRYVLYQSILS